MSVAVAIMYWHFTLFVRKFEIRISISPCIKINADAVGLHITQVFTEPGNCYFYGANCVVYEAFPFKCFLRPKLQITTLVCDADVFEMEIINTLNVTLLLLMICKELWKML